jgi:hypothetical protein
MRLQRFRSGRTDRLELQVTARRSMGSGDGPRSNPAHYHRVRGHSRRHRHRFRRWRRRETLRGGCGRVQAPASRGRVAGDIRAGPRPTTSHSMSWTGSSSTIRNPSQRHQSSDPADAGGSRYGARAANGVLIIATARPCGGQQPDQHAHVLRCFRDSAPHSDAECAGVRGIQQDGVQQLARAAVDVSTATCRRGRGAQRHQYLRHGLAGRGDQAGSPVGQRALDVGRERRR